MIIIPPNKQIVTSLRVDHELWKKAKMEAIRNDMTLANLLEEAIEDWIRNKNPEEKQENRK